MTFSVTPASCYVRVAMQAVKENAVAEYSALRACTARGRVRRHCTARDGDFDADREQTLSCYYTRPGYIPNEGRPVVAHYRVYVRYSDKHSAQGSSEERQWDIERHRERAAELEAKLGEKIELVEVPYVDRAESGFHGDNLEAELGRIKADIQSGAIPKRDILCAEAHDRLGRLRPGEAVMQYLGFLRDGIRLDIKGVLRSWQSINGEQGLPTLMNDFIDIFLAYQESLTKQKHARHTNQIKRKKRRDSAQQGVMRTGSAGWFVGSRCPAWVRPVHEPIVIDDHIYL